MKSIEEMSQPELVAIAKINTALEAMPKAQGWIDTVRADRDAAIIELRELGWTVADTAIIAGLSGAAVQKIGDAAGLRSTRVARRG